MEENEENRSDDAKFERQDESQTGIPVNLMSLDEQEVVQRLEGEKRPQEAKKNEARPEDS